MNTFQYGKVVSLKLPYADCPSSRDFYCIDKATVDLIRILAKQTSFPRWKKYDADFWHREEPSNSLWISKTGRGWLASRGYRYVEKTLTHQDYIMPILFPDPETTLAASELCYPQPHPALSWPGPKPDCMTDPDAQEDSALGNVGWERSLREGAWSALTHWKDEQASARAELHSDATLGDLLGTAFKTAHLHNDQAVTEH